MRSPRERAALTMPGTGPALLEDYRVQEDSRIRALIGRAGEGPLSWRQPCAQVSREWQEAGVRSIQGVRGQQR